jgi:FtsZ-binding cell division protein ZapB
MIKLIIIIGGLFLFVISPVYGDLYKYYDENGILSFTDDLAQVPESQKSDAETVVKTKTDSPPEAAPDEPKTQEKAPDPKRLERQKLMQNLDLELETLTGMRQELDRKYRSLKERRDALEVESETQMSIQEKAAFKKRIEALNEETLKYREKTDAYEKRVKDYNARINAL